MHSQLSQGPQGDDQLLVKQACAAEQQLSQQGALPLRVVRHPAPHCQRPHRNAQLLVVEACRAHPPHHQLHPAPAQCPELGQAIADGGQLSGPAVVRLLLSKLPQLLHRASQLMPCLHPAWHHGQRRTAATHSSLPLLAAALRHTGSSPSCPGLPCPASSQQVVRHQAGHVVNEGGEVEGIEQVRELHPQRESRLPAGGQLDLVGQECVQVSRRGWRGGQCQADLPCQLWGDGVALALAGAGLQVLHLLHHAFQLLQAESFGPGTITPVIPVRLA
ncbi:hypothetical protein V8C86DRAFT_2498445 [Haematococcus lacustris]